MEVKAGKRKFRISLFDIVIVVLVILLALGCLYIKNHKSSSGGTYTQVYQVEINKVSESTQDMIKVGDPIIDKIKKLDMGEVTDVEFVPYTEMTTDMVDHKQVEMEIPGKTRALITLSAECVDDGNTIKTTAGYELAVGTEAYICGPGYSGAGYIISMDRSDD